MEHERLQIIRRELLSGRVVAQHAIPIDPFVPEGRKRRRREEILADERRVEERVQGNWHEEGFIDDFYDEEDADIVNAELDVVPDYFESCDILVTSYAASSDGADNVASMPLFPGSAYLSKDLARFLLSLKARHLKIGDGVLAHIVGAMATFLPKGNTLATSLPEKTSTYFLLKTLDNLAAYKSNLRTLKIHVCIKKCMGFYNNNAALNVCTVCNECRWKECLPDCYAEDGEKLCDHQQSPRDTLYYNVVQDRLVKLLKSGLRNLFNYQHHRAGECGSVLIYLDLSCVQMLICLDLS